MGRADLKPVAVGWGRSRRRCVCPRRYGQTHRGHGRKDKDARERGSAFHEWRSLLLLLSHPGLAVVTRLSGARADSCNGNRRTQFPRLRVHLRFFVLAKNSASRKKLGQDPGEESFHLHSRYNACRTAFGIQLRESGVTGCSPHNASISAEPA
jgi:hypothetical protein